MTLENNEKDIDKLIKEQFHSLSSEQWEETKNTFPYCEIPFIVKRAVEISKTN